MINRTFLLLKKVMYNNQMFKNPNVLAKTSAFPLMKAEVLASQVKALGFLNI